MKHIKMLTAAAFAAIMTAGILDAAAETLIIAGDPWLPYNGDQNKKGYVIEAAEAALAIEGLTVSYTPVPWSRALREARDGNYDAIVGASREDAAEFIFPDEELGMSRDEFCIAASSSWNYENLNSVNALRLGVTKDYAYGPESLNIRIWELAKEQKNIFVMTGNDAVGKNMKRIITGDLDAIIDDGLVLRYYAGILGIKNKVKFIPTGDRYDKIYIAFSPVKTDSKAHAKALSRGITAIRKNGTLHRILSRYGVTDWKK